MDGHRASLRESRALAAVSIAFMGHFSGFPWANHFDLPGSLSISGISQDPSVDAHASLGVARSYRKGLWVA